MAGKEENTREHRESLGKQQGHMGELKRLYNVDMVRNRANSGLPRKRISASLECNLCHAFNERHSHRGLNLVGPVRFGQFENVLDNGDLGGGSVKATEAGPIVNYQTGTDQFRVSVYGASDQWDLEE